MSRLISLYRYRMKSLEELDNVTIHRSMFKITARSTRLKYDRLTRLKYDRVHRITLRHYSNTVSSRFILLFLSLI